MADTIYSPKFIGDKVLIGGYGSYKSRFNLKETRAIIKEESLWESVDMVSELTNGITWMKEPIRREVYKVPATKETTHLGEKIQDSLTQQIQIQLEQDKGELNIVKPSIDRNNSGNFWSSQHQNSFKDYFSKFNTFVMQQTFGRTRRNNADN